MGYYTSFTLTARSCVIENNLCTITPHIPDNIAKDLEAEIAKMNVFEFGDLESTYWVNGKWYDWEEDMCLLSKRYPQILFRLHGEGENNDDLWEAYFFEGKFQYCPAVITYDDFEPSALRAGRESEDTRNGMYSYQD